MTDKEIYKARAEGLNRISEIKNEVSDADFLEFMCFVREAAGQYQPEWKLIQQEIMEKCEIRKKLNKLFNNEPI